MTIAEPPPKSNGAPVECDPPPTTLSEFIKDNSQLITALAAFVALTVFAAQLDSDVRQVLPGLTLLAAFLISFELLMQMPAKPRHWRLEIFELILVALPMFVLMHWFLRFPTLWAPILFMAIAGTVLMVLAGSLAYGLLKIVTWATMHLLHRSLSPRRNRHLRFVLLIVSMAAVTAVLLVAEKRVLRNLPSSQTDKKTLTKVP